MAIPSATGRAKRWWWIPSRCCRRPILRSMRRWACRITATCTSSSAFILLNPDTLADDLEITANKLLAKTWKTTRKVLPAASAEVRHRRGRVRAGQLHRGRRQERQLDLCAHQVPQWRSSRFRLEMTPQPMHQFMKFSFGAFILAAAAAACVARMRASLLRGVRPDQGLDVEGQRQVVPVDQSSLRRLGVGAAGGRRRSAGMELRDHQPGRTDPRRLDPQFRQDGRSGQREFIRCATVRMAED